MGWYTPEEKSPQEGDIVPILTNGIKLYAIYSSNHGFIYSGPTNVFQTAIIMDLPEIGTIIKPSLWGSIYKVPDETPS